MASLRTIFATVSSTASKTLVATARNCQSILASGRFVALSPKGQVGFLPWQMLAYGLSQASTVEIRSVHETDDEETADERNAALRCEICRLTGDLRRQENVVKDMIGHIDNLEQELKRPNFSLPSSWLL